jgi:hypothetical protein
MKKFVDIVSDRDINRIASDVGNDDVVDMLWEMWRDDLDVEMSKEQLLFSANGILKYFESQNRVTDVDWDEEGKCFLWEVEGYESAT